MKCLSESQVKVFYLLYHATLNLFSDRFRFWKMSSALRDRSRTTVSVRVNEVCDEMSIMISLKWLIAVNPWPKTRLLFWNKCYRSCMEPDWTGIIHSPNVDCKTLSLQCGTWSIWKEMRASTWLLRRSFPSFLTPPTLSPSFDSPNQWMILLTNISTL